MWGTALGFGCFLFVCFLFLIMHNPRRTANLFALPQTSGQGFSSPLFKVGPAFQGFMQVDLTSPFLLYADFRLRLLFLLRPSEPSPWGPLSRSETTRGLDSPPHPGLEFSFHRAPVRFPDLTDSGMLLLVLVIFVQFLCACSRWGWKPSVSGPAAMLLEAPVIKKYETEMIPSENCDDYLPFCQMTTTHIFFSSLHNSFKLEKINIPKAFWDHFVTHTWNSHSLFLPENFSSMRTYLLAPFSHYPFIL